MLHETRPVPKFTASADYAEPRSTTSSHSLERGTQRRRPRPSNDRCARTGRGRDVPSTQGPPRGRGDTARHVRRSGPLSWLSSATRRSQPFLTSWRSSRCSTRAGPALVEDRLRAGLDAEGSASGIEPSVGGSAGEADGLSGFGDGSAVGQQPEQRPLLVRQRRRRGTGLDVGHPGELVEERRPVPVGAHQPARTRRSGTRPISPCAAAAPMPTATAALPTPGHW